MKTPAPLERLVLAAGLTLRVCTPPCQRSRSKGRDNLHPRLASPRGPVARPGRGPIPRPGLITPSANYDVRIRNALRPRLRAIDSVPSNASSGRLLPVFGSFVGAGSGAAAAVSTGAGFSAGTTR